MTTGNSPQASPSDPARKDGESETAASEAILHRLAALSPQSDRATLVRTIDAAVAAVLGRLRSKQPGTPLGDDLMRLTRTTLACLEACASLHDPEFAKQNKAWAAQLQEALATAAVPAAAPAGPARAAEAPARKKSAPPAKAAAAKEPPAKPLGPAEAFEATFCRFIRRRAEAFEVLGRSQERLPFLVAPAFSVVFEQIVKTHFVPGMVANRRIKGLTAHLNPSDLETGLLALYEEGGQGNVVHALWDELWGDVGQGLLVQNKAEPEVRRKREKKQSWLERFGLGKSRDDEEDDDADDEPEAAAPKRDPELAKQVWHALEGGAVDGNFHPPLTSDIPIFRSLFTFDPDAIDEAKASVQQLLEQEASGNAREGVTRDFLNQQFKILPAPCGEILALWTYYQHREQFNYKILRSFESSHGQTAEQRRKFLPLFMRWAPDFTTVKVKI